MNAEQEFAARLFEGVFGQPAPRVIPWTEWAISIHDNDGSLPLCSFDRATSTLHVNIHEGQREAMDVLARFVFMIAGKQSGKTVLGPIWLFREIQRMGAGDYLAISATFDLFKLKLLPAIKELFVGTLGIARYWPSDRILELCDPLTGEFGATYSHEHEKMWGRIILRTAESEEGMQSATAKAALLDEAGLYKWDVWKDIRGRLALAQGRAFAPTTPYDLGWLKQQIYDLWVGGDPEIGVVQFESRKSPFFSEAEWESLKRTMQRWQFEMDYGGQFGRPPAAIYETFVDADVSAGGHKCKRFVIPKEWAIVAAVDPGVVNPAKGWFAHDAHTNTYYLFRTEKGGERRSSLEHGQADVALAGREGWRVIWWAVGAKSEIYWREDYRKAGAKNVREPDSNDVEEGINRGTQLINEHRFVVFDDQVEFLDEMLRYSREIKDGEVTKNIKDKSTFHLIDMFRYFAVQVVKARMPFTTQTGAQSYIGGGSR